MVAFFPDMVYYSIVPVRFRIISRLVIVPFCKAYECVRAKGSERENSTMDHTGSQSLGIEGKVYEDQIDRTQVAKE